MIKIQECTLENILSLWETLAVEQSKRAVIAGQVITMFPHCKEFNTNTYVRISLKASAVISRNSWN